MVRRLVIGGLWALVVSAGGLVAFRLVVDAEPECIPFGSAAIDPSPGGYATVQEAAQVLVAFHTDLESVRIPPISREHPEEDGFKVTFDGRIAYVKLAHVESDDSPTHLIVVQEPDGTWTASSWGKC